MLSQRLVVVGLAFGLLSGAFASPAFGSPPDVESPPTGIHPSEFATEHTGCLGALRSQLARGEFAGVGPFGDHFTGQVNPGAHQGTVGEEEFLRDVLGITDIGAFCSQFE